MKKIRSIIGLQIQFRVDSCHVLNIIKMHNYRMQMQIHFESCPNLPSVECKLHGWQEAIKKHDSRSEDLYANTTKLPMFVNV
jgi:hypothetical protein